MENKKFTRLTLERANNMDPTNDIKLVWEIPYDDVTTTDLFNAFKTIMCGMGFVPESFNRYMADYLKIYADDEFEIYDSKDNNDIESESNGPQYD